LLQVLFDQITDDVRQPALAFTGHSDGIRLGGNKEGVQL
jgi:hypothetical protein